MWNNIYALKADGVPWVWGYNNYGQLGTNNLTSYSSPVAMVGNHSFLSIFSGIRYFVGVKWDGSVWVCGGNSAGELGTNNRTSYSSPVAVVGNHNFIFVCGEGDPGYGSTFGLKSSGAAWAWGSNTAGQLGTNNRTSYSSPVAVVGNHSFTQIYSGGNNYNTIALKADTGAAWTWGNNNAGQLGTNNTTSYSSPVAVVGNHSFIKVFTCRSASGGRCYALKANGQVWVWGGDVIGELGTGVSSISYSSPVQVIGNHSFIDIQANFSHAAALKADGSIWSWGSNSAGQLGINSTTNTSSPVQMIGNHSFVQIACGYRCTFGLKANGEVWAVGLNSEGQLGHGDMINYSSPVLVIGNHSFTQIGTNHPIRAYFTDTATWHRGRIAYVNIGGAWGRATEAWVNVGGSAWNKFI